MAKGTLPDMFRELERPHNFNALHKNVTIFLKSKGIINDVHSVKSELVDRGKRMERFVCQVPADENVFREKIQIIIRPDSKGETMALDVAAQIGGAVELKHEDKDDGKSLKKVFHRERTLIIRDIESFIDEQLSKKHYRKVV